MFHLYLTGIVNEICECAVPISSMVFFSFQHSSQSVLDENERIFTELLRALERRHGEVKEMIRAQETLLLTRADGHLARLEEEITLLRKKHNDLEQLSQSDDHIHFLQVLLKKCCGP